MTAGALDGLRVLDLSNQLSGPYCAMLLGDLGADVIKVEHPVGGDPARLGAPHRGGESAPFMTVNRNKRSITVDLKTPDGLAIARRLAARADVVLENWRPGAAARLGLGYDDVRRSEEHTSELQSQSNLVCRLLLEKKKTTTQHQET